MSREKHRDNWEKAKLEHSKQMDIWNELLPDGFEDAQITENLTGKAPKLPTSLPPRGRSSID
jgi:hypothetical protein